jgi:hypothetical protein
VERQFCLQNENNIDYRSNQNFKHQ